MGKRKARRRKKEVAINGKAILYIYFGLFQPCAFFKSIRIYLFYALDMVNNFPSAHVPGHLKDGAVQGQYHTDFEIDLWYDDNVSEYWIRNFE